MSRLSQITGDMPPLERKLRWAMLGAGIGSMAELARRLGLATPRTIYNWTHGSRIPNAWSREKMRKLLGVDIFADEQGELPEGDLCDKCMRSGVQISHTEDGKTVCVDCADPETKPECEAPEEPLRILR